MRKFNLELPKYRLQLNYRLVKRRKPLIDEPLIPSVRTVKRKYRKGSLVGRYFRHIFEHKNLRQALAANFAIAVITTSFLPQPTNILAQETDEPIIEAQTNLVTEKGVQFPVGKVRLTQGFSFFHPGVDLDGVTGDPIKPIKPGRVISVDYSRFAYGNSIIIEHGNNLSSLYAHLSKIEVQQGQSVDMNVEIGKMGATGRAFGDHLHLEVYDHGKAINPLLILR